jgi:error-prone DNA polymerase
LGLNRRDALWAIKALRDAPMPLFEASAGSSEAAAQTQEPAALLKPMTGGREVVEDYGHVGLTLRSHPLAFLRQDLGRRGYAPCLQAARARDGARITLAGLVLVRQKPGSAKGVMFITIEDETGVANLVIWPSLYEAQRRIILTASMLGVLGRTQREGEVVHVVAHELQDLSSDLAGLGGRETPFRLPHGRGDEFHNGPSAPDPRDGPLKGMAGRDLFAPDLHLDTIKLKSRDFR